MNLYRHVKGTNGLSCQIMDYDGEYDTFLVHYEEDSLPPRWEERKDLEVYRLKDFPLVMRSFDEIEMDNAGGRSRALKPETEIPEHWLIPFRCAENSLHRCGDYLISGIEKEGGWEYTEDTTMWQVLSVPVDDDDWIVNRWLGIGEAQAWVVSHLFGEFFDGELSNTFQEKRR